VRPLILLDTGVIGILINPKSYPDAVACRRWLGGVEAAGISIAMALICYYEARREWDRLILRDREADPARGRVWLGALGRLERLAGRVTLAPCDRKTMIIVAGYWAEARARGLPTAPDESLDADVILAATARRASRGGRDVCVITTNVAHLSRFVPARRWDEYPAD